MFDELKNLNIGTCSDAEIKAWVKQAIPVVATFVQATQRLTSQDHNLCKNCGKSAQLKKDNMQMLISDGTISSKNKMSGINEDDYDIILDMTTNSLRYRQDPVEHTELIESKLQSIGSRRIELLAYLLEHPSRHISIESAAMLPSQLDLIEPNALSKSISLLRKALGQKGPKGPYILTKAVWGRNYRYAYQMNSKWRYLVVGEKNEKSQTNQSRGNHKVRLGN